MFLGIWGRMKGLPEKQIVELCYRYAEAFERRFGSLLCRELRPGGFGDDDPPYLCENLTKASIRFSCDFTDKNRCL